MKQDSYSSVKCLLWSFAKGVAGAAILSTVIIVLISGREDRDIPGADAKEGSMAKADAKPQAGKQKPVEFWMGDRRINTRAELDAARSARREKTKEYYLAAYDGSEDYRRRQIAQVRTQYNRDQIDDDLEEASLTEEEINRMEREGVMIW